MNDISPNPRAVFGGNLPPLVDPEALAEHEGRVRDFCDAGGAFLDLGEIADDETAAKLKELIDRSRKVTKDIEAARSAAKKPFDDAGKEVMKLFLPLVTAMDTLVGKLKPMQTAYLQRKQRELEERQRVQREEAAKAAADADAALAAAESRNDVLGIAQATEAAKAAEEASEAAARDVRAKVESVTGAGKASSLRQTRKLIVENWRVAFSVVQEDAGVREAIRAALAAKVRSKDWNGETPLGCRIEIIETAV